MSQDPYTQNPYEDPPPPESYEGPPAYDGPPAYEVPGPYDDPATYENLPERKPYEPPANSFAGAPARKHPDDLLRSPYGPLPGYANGQQHGYVSTPPAPLPLSQAIRELPRQYLRVLTRPSSATLAGEMSKANWDIVWIQLIGYAIITAILNYLTLQASPDLLTLPGITLSPASRQALTLGTSIASIFVVPIGFFIGVGIFYLIARAFGGRGTFLRQSYTTALFDIPLGIINSLLFFIPVASLGTFLFFVLLVYRLVLYGCSIMAVHGLGRGKAALVVLIPVVVIMLFMACALSLPGAQ
ncbi:MAG TPA: YIP1 family protein [Ktedonobacteraceae bacterium]|jgi:hypothetical protein|nr:YIP1 family protein [Ktedonobacteraceae bacterium]